MSNKNNKFYLQHIFKYAIRYSVMLTYILILFGVLFCKRRVGSIRSVNLIPFREIMNYFLGNDIIVRNFAWSNLLGNVVVCIPLGIYLTMLRRDKSVIFNTLIITLFSILAEIIQFVFSVGVADIDDVILNSIGGCCGVILWKLLFWVFRDRTQFVIDIVAPIGGVLAFLIIYLVNR